MLLPKKYLFILILTPFFYTHTETQKKIENPLTFLRDRIRDITIEAVIVQNFVLNSDKIVEVDSANYPALDATVESISQKAGIHRPLTFVITRKVPHFFAKANAFTCGDENESVIFVGSWVLENMSHEEIEGILAHEITHIKKNHVLKRMGHELLSTAGSLVIATLVQQYFFKQAEHSWLTLIGTVVIGLSVASALNARYSRSCEKEADLGAVQLMGNKKLAQSLQKLDRILKKYAPYTHWQKKNNPSIFDTHPSTDARIAYIEAAEILAPAK